MRRNKVKTPFVDPSVGKTIEKSRTTPSTAKFKTKEIEFKTKDTPKRVYKEKEVYRKGKEKFKAVIITGGKRKVVVNEKKRSDKI